MQESRKEVQFVVHEVKLWPMNCNLSGIEHTKILDQLQTDKPRRIAFVDIAPTWAVWELIQGLIRQGHSMILYLDHHRDRANEQYAQYIEQHINIRKHQPLRRDPSRKSERVCRIVSRQDAVCATQLVNPGMWYTHDIDVVFYDMDADGRYAAWKGLRVTYPGMDDDARIYDGGGGVGDRPTEMGMLTTSAIALLPHFSLYPGEYVKEWIAQEEFFRHVILRRSVGMNASQKRGLARIREDLNIAHNNAKTLFDSLSPPQHGLFFVDVSRFSEENTLLNAFAIKQFMRETWGRENVFCMADYGRSKQVYVQVTLPQCMQHCVDLRNFREFGNAHSAFRIYVPLNKWEGFKQEWERIFPLITRKMSLKMFHWHHLPNS